MRKYTDNEYLMRFVQANDLVNLKEELLNNIFFLQGDRKEIGQALEYIFEHTSFEFDTHIDMPIDISMSYQDQYTAEVINMGDNFSEQRFDKLLNLFEIAYKGEQEDEKKNETLEFSAPRDLVVNSADKKGQDSIALTSNTVKQEQVTSFDKTMGKSNKNLYLIVAVVVFILFYLIFI